MATAAVGGSHLVASTQAGAKFGWQLAILILAVNLLKYPFFRAGVSYTIATKQTLQYGYCQMGKGYLLVALALNVLASVVNSAALLLFSASLLSYFVPFELSIIVASAAILCAILFILLAGHFEALEGVAKAIMGVLVLATVAAFFAALSSGAVKPQGFESPSPWTLATLGFLVVTMGWMPAPIEISSITSLWLKRQCQSQNVSSKSALFDFNLGYAVTTILALLFLGLGALVLHGSGQELASGGIGFSQQLVSLYATTIGSWSHWLIAMVAFLCIFGSALTVYDGYSRVIAEAITLAMPSNKKTNAWFVPVLLMVALISFCIVLFFKSALIAMLGFAMTLAFITTPMFAWLNHRLVKLETERTDVKESAWVRFLSYAGLGYLFGFLALFIWWKWL